jgi:uncharacterized membrane protein YqjE
MQATKQTPDSARDDDRSGGLLAQLRRIPTLISRLVQDEIAAAKAELAGKAKAAALGIGLVGGGVVLALFGLGTLINAAVYGLSRVLPAWLSALIVGLALVVVAVVLALVGISKLKKGMPPVPSDTIDSVKQDVRTVKGTR